MEALNLWFESVGISANTATPKVNEYQVSFHLPLHRYVCLQNSLISIIFAQLHIRIKLDKQHTR